MATKSNARKYFGTDGIRSLANNGILNPNLCVRVGQAAGLVFRRGGHRHSVVIGKDPRISGYMIETGLVSGFLSVGIDVQQLGPVPTPAVAMITRSMGADIGVMISASHNLYPDNGIKLFGPDGYKLSNDQELKIEELIDDEATVSRSLVKSPDLGKAERIDGAAERYVEIAKATLPRGLQFEGMRVVIDCANGAAYKVAPKTLKELDIEVVAIGVNPNGFNINHECGSTVPGALQQKVLEVRADLGIALDGDADRMVLVDETGHIVDGDQVLAVVAESFKTGRRLAKSGVVGTVMSNIGLERYFAKKHIRFERSAVGDRYVLEKMREVSSNLGGEQSGHIIMSDHATTGDGLVAALQVLAVIKKTGAPASKVLHRFEPVPQVLKNVRYQGTKPLKTSAVKKAIAWGEKTLGREAGRLVIRASGTEPLIRVMGQGDDKALVEQVVKKIVSAIEAKK